MLALEVDGLSVWRASVHAVREVSFTLAHGEIRGILGLNGAGKSSLLAALAGAIPSRAGTVRIGGRDVTRAPAWTRCKAGLATVPSGRQLFPEMSVNDNLLIGANLMRNRRAVASNLERAYEMFPAMNVMRHRRAGALSGGQQQMVAVARAMMADPAVMLLDEPSEGLAPIIVDSLFDIIRNLADARTSVLLAEQNPGALRICDTVMLMRNGDLSSAEEGGATTATSLADYVFEA